MGATDRGGLLDPSPEGGSPVEIGDRYLIEREIGRGGMGRVFVAHDRKLGREVAIKVLAPGLLEEEALRRFEQEARAAAALNHANILDVHDIGVHHGRPYIVSELLRGSTLRERLERGPVPPDEAAALALQLAQGLAAAHGKGIIHRDLKPENLFLAEDGRLKILDFGIAKLVAPAPASAETPTAPRTGTGRVIGTVGYMSPEQTRGLPADRRSDVFSFGTILYELLSGRNPFERGTAIETGYAVLRDEPPNLPAATPAALAAIVRRCVEKEPRRRYASGGELVQALTSAQEVQTKSGSGRRIAAIFALAAAFAIGWFAWREARIRRARDRLPTIARLAEEGRPGPALALAEEVERIIPGDPVLVGLLKEVSVSCSIETSPPGAEVSVANPDSLEFRHLGRAPLRVRLALTPHRWRIAKEGFSSVETMLPNGRDDGSAPILSGKLRFVLDRDLPPGMVRVPGGPVRLETPVYSRIPSIELPDYFIDRYEVTNREFKRFVEEGGYARRELWTEPFRDGGRVLTWEDAGARFRDRTGRPGPAGWISGDYPEGEDDFPVTGVSWYEAAAYASFARKALPTIYHWNHAAGISLAHLIIPASNFGPAGLARVGSHRDLDGYGAQDMAGNAREWCWNETSGKRYVLGGAWNDPAHLFNELDALPPFDRSAANGFRLVKYLDEARIPASVKGPLPELRARDYASEKPVSDAVFEVFRRLYAYDRTGLQPSVESIDESNDRFRREKVGYAGASAGERAFAYLYTPRHVPPPWQVVLYFPGAAAIRVNAIDELPPSLPLFIVKSGRALALPVLKGTLERRDGLTMTDQEPGRTYRDHVVAWSNDLGRTLDYLERRPEFDRRAIAYYGYSWGAKMGPIMLALEPRIRAAVLVSGGFNLGEVAPEADPFNFAPRVRQPVLLINGRYDFQFPVASSQEPFFRTLGTPEPNKRRVIFDSGHRTPDDLTVKETLDWLDRWLGAAR